MSTDHSDLLALSPAEQLQIVEMLWDHLGESSTAIPLPAWVDKEGVRRRKEMTDNPELGVGHDETWDRIERGHG